MKKLKELRTERGLYQKDVAEYLKIDRTTYVKYESGVSEPNHEMLCKIADFFNVTVDYLLGNETAGKKKGIKIPVYGTVAAGVPIEAITDIEDYEEIDEDMARNGDHIALKIKGDSMEPRMVNGDVVIVRLQPDACDGETAIVMVNGDEATCKKIKKTPEGIMLISTNPAYEPMFYSNKQIEELPIRILGKVVELRAKY